MSTVTHFAKRTVCLRRRLHAKLGVKVLKGFQLLFVPRSGVNHVSVIVEPAISSQTIPSIRNYSTHGAHRRRICTAYNSRLKPFEHNFHNDMREQERSSHAACCMAPPDIQSGSRGRWPPISNIIHLWNQYSSGIMNVLVGEMSTTVSHCAHNCAHNIDIVHCRRHWMRFKMNAMVKRRKRESWHRKVQWTPPAGQIATFFSTPSLLWL